MDADKDDGPKVGAKNSSAVKSDGPDIGGPNVGVSNKPPTDPVLLIFP